MICSECCEYSHDENVCVNCGLVVNDRPVLNIPERLTDKKTKNKREYSNSLSPYSEIQTRLYLPTKNHDYNRMFSKCNGLDNEINTRNYITAYIDISRICSFLQFRNIIKEESLNLYKSIIKINDKFFGKKYHKFIGHAACICIACDKYNEIYSFNDICELIKTTNDFNFVLKKLKKVYCEIGKMFNLSNSNIDNPNYITYVGDTLKLSQEFITKMHIIYQNLKPIFKSHFFIKGYILAIFAIYGKLYGITIKVLGETFNISTPTITSRIQEIREFLMRR